MHRIHLSSALACLLAAAPASAQIVVGDGESLVDAVDAATSGQTISIESDETFVGTLVLSGKTLTVRAGAGFAPTIQGSDGSAAVLVSSNSAGTDLTLIDLVVDPGEKLDGEPQPASIGISGTGSSANTARLELRRTTVTDRFTASGTGAARFEVELKDSTVNGPIAIGGTLDAVHDWTIEDGSRIDSLEANPISSARVTVTITDSVVEGEIELASSSSAETRLALQRCRVLDSIDASAGSATSNTVALLESCLLLGDGTGVGLTSDGKALHHAK